MMDCVFCKIAGGVIPKEFIYEDKDIMIFPDINPSREIHILIVPKKHFKDFMDLIDSKLMAKIFSTVQTMIKKNKLENTGYKVLINGGGAQIIDHMHIHLTGPWGKNETIKL